MARQEVHEETENAEQLYSVTEDGGGRMKLELNTHVLTLDGSMRINWIHNCTTVGPNKVDVSYHNRGSNRKGDLEGEAAILIKKIPSSHSHLSCILTTNRCIADVVGRQRDIRSSIW